MKAGMNCTAWNSVVARALTDRPRAVPSSASSTATTTTSHAAPHTVMPYGPKHNPETTRAWTMAANPRAIA